MRGLEKPSENETDGGGDNSFCNIIFSAENWCVSMTFLNWLVYRNARNQVNFQWIKKKQKKPNNTEISFTILREPLQSYNDSKNPVKSAEPCT